MWMRPFAMESCWFPDPMTISCRAMRCRSSRDQENVATYLLLAEPQCPYGQTRWYGASGMFLAHSASLILSPVVSQTRRMAR